MQTQDLIKIKHTIPLLKEMTKEEIKDLLKISKIRLYHPKQVIFKEGEVPDGMYIILNGGVTVEKRLYQGDHLVLGKLGKGDVFGEMALIEETNRSATVKARSQGATVFFIERVGFSHYRKMYHPASMKILRHIAIILTKRAIHIESIMIDFFNNPEKSISFLEKRYLKYSGHPNLDNQ